jgi:hypothetical protein
VVATMVGRQGRGALGGHNKNQLPTIAGPVMGLGELSLRKTGQQAHHGCGLTTPGHFVASRSRCPMMSLIRRGGSARLGLARASEIAGRLSLGLRCERVRICRKLAGLLSLVEG